MFLFSASFCTNVNQTRSCRRSGPGPRMSRRPDARARALPVRRFRAPPAAAKGLSAPGARAACPAPPSGTGPLTRFLPLFRPRLGAHLLVGASPELGTNYSTSPFSALATLGRDGSGPCPRLRAPEGRLSPSLPCCIPGPGFGRRFINRGAGDAGVISEVPGSRRSAPAPPAARLQPASFSRPDPLSPGGLTATSRVRLGRSSPRKQSSALSRPPRSVLSGSPRKEGSGLRPHRRPSAGLSPAGSAGAKDSRFRPPLPAGGGGRGPESTRGSEAEGWGESQPGP